MSTRTPAQTIDDYIALAPVASQLALRQIRLLVKNVAPMAKESINYGIPTFQLDKKKFHFGGYEKHIGIYPTPPVISAFSDELQGRTLAKGSVQFPLVEDIPYPLIKRMAKAALLGHE